MGWWNWWSCWHNLTERREPFTPFTCVTWKNMKIRDEELLSSRAKLSIAEEDGSLCEEESERWSAELQGQSIVWNSRNIGAFWEFCSREISCIFSAGNWQQAWQKRLLFSLVSFVQFPPACWQVAATFYWFDFVSGIKPEMLLILSLIFVPNSLLFVEPGNWSKVYVDKLKQLVVWSHWF